NIVERYFSTGAQFVAFLLKPTCNVPFCNPAIVHDRLHGLKVTTETNKKRLSSDGDHSPVSRVNIGGSRRQLNNRKRVQHADLQPTQMQRIEATAQSALSILIEFVRNAVKK